MEVKHAESNPNRPSVRRGILHRSLLYSKSLHSERLPAERVSAFLPQRWIAAQRSGDAVLKLHATIRDHGGRTSVIRLVGRDVIGADRAIGCITVAGGSEKRHAYQSTQGK